MVEDFVFCDEPRLGVYAALGKEDPKAVGEAREFQRSRLTCDRHNRAASPILTFTLYSSFYDHPLVA